MTRAIGAPPRAFTATIDHITVETHANIVIVRRDDFTTDHTLSALCAVHGTAKVATEIAAGIAHSLATGASVDQTRKNMWEPMTRALRHFTYSAQARERRTQLDAINKVFGAAAAWQADGEARAKHAAKAGAR